MTAASGNRTAIDIRIETERIRLFYRQLHLAVFFTLFALGLFGLTLWHDVDNRPVMLIWIAAMTAIQVARLGLAVSFSRMEPAPDDLKRWRTWAIVGGAATGIGWASTAVFLFDPGDHFNLMIMIATAAGVVAGGAAIMTALPESYYAYVAGHVPALAIALAAQGTLEMATLAVGTLVFAGLMVTLAHLGKKSLDESLRLRFERLDMIEHLETARVEAESASRAKSEFLTLMTHELRTPLNSIIGYAELIAGLPDARRGGKLGAYAQDIDDGARRLLALINDILDLSKVDAGTLHVHESLFDVAASVERCRRAMVPFAVEFDVTLKIEDGGKLPAIRGDERLVRQALLNLISNGVKFTPPGGIVRVGASRTDDGGVAVVIADTGIGMAPEDVPRALEPFHQIDHGLNREHDGSGLGLPLAKRFAELHGGRLEIASRQGEGTTVRLVLPAERVVA